MLFRPADNAITTIECGADFLKVTQPTIYRLASAKKIPAFSVGVSWNFSKVDIDLRIKEQSAADGATNK